MESDSVIHYFNTELISTSAALKTQNDELVELIEKQARELAELGAKLNKVEREKENLELDRNYHRDMVNILRKQLYGSKSERHVVDESPSRQLLLPGFEDTDRPKPPPVTTEKISYTRRKPAPEGTRGPRNSRFPRYLRRVQEIVEPITCECPQCQGALEGTGKFDITEKLCASRDPFYVKEFHRELMVCRHCGSAQTRPPVPEVFERSLFDHTTVAYCIALKFVYGVPFYRQGKMYKEMQIKVSSDSICRISLQGLELLTSIYKALCSSVLRSPIIVADDTRLLAASGEVAKKLPQYKRGCLWGVFGSANEVMYEFAPSRTHEACDTLLEQFSGQFLVCDGYSGFDNFVKNNPRMTLVNCNNHARRKFVEALQSDQTRADEALTYYQHLYRIEDEAATFSSEDRFKHRQTHAVPLLEQFKAWNEAVLIASQKKDPIHTAVNYILSRWNSLTAYLDDGRLPFDSMQIERAFRIVAVGRKNWLHASSEVGAQMAAVGYTIINSCSLIDVDPYVYMADVFEKISDRNFTNPECLIPRVWKERYYERAQEKFLRFEGP
jgi:transposase